MNINKIIYAAAAYVTMVACTPTQMRLKDVAPLDRSKLKYSVTQQQGHDNVIYLNSLTSGAIPYWSYDGGSSTNALDTLIFPFSGQYLIRYSVSSEGGYVQGDSTTITVTNTDLSTITDPSWEYLTNGQTGKTWILDMSKPIGWYGFDYLKHNASADDWNWHPDYAGNEWVMPNIDYGSMTFDLNNAKNYTKVTKDAGGNASTCNAKFNLDPASHKLNLTGCGMLFGGDYFAQVGSWSNITILELTATSMTLAVVRDHPNPGDGPCWIGFTFKPKP
jgi:hypothetical protein